MQEKCENVGVAVIVVNWEGWSDTIACLESLFQSSYTDYYVVVCDNGSRNGSIPKVKAWAEGILEVGDDALEVLGEAGNERVSKPIRYVETTRQEVEQHKVAQNIDGASLIIINNNENLGFAGGCNVGIKYVQLRGDYKYIWLLNNDTVVNADAMAEMVSCMEGDKGIGMCGSTLLYYDHPEDVQAYGGGKYNKWLGNSRHIAKPAREKFNLAVHMDYIVGASLMVSGSFIEKIGLMEEEYFLYFEELDWARRCKGKFKLGYASASIVYHKEGKSAGTSSQKGQMSVLADFYINRNRLLFTDRYYPWAIPTLMVALIAAVANRVRRRQFGRAVMIMRMMITYLFYGRKKLLEMRHLVRGK